MGIEENKSLVRRWLQSHAGSASDISLLAPDHVNHGLPPGTPQGRDAARVGLEMIHRAFSDIHWTIDDIMADGDRVVVRGTATMRHTGDFRGIKATGREVGFSAIQWWTIRDGLLGDLWQQYDTLGFMQQLGAIPRPG